MPHRTYQSGGLRGRLRLPAVGSRGKEGGMPSELFEKGLAIRREVLGDEYVDRSLAQADEFTMPLQELVTEHALGARSGDARGSRGGIAAC